MMNLTERSGMPAEAATAPDTLRCPRLGLGVTLLLSTALIAFTTDVTPVVGQAANQTVRPDLSSDFAASSRAEFLKTAIGIKRQQADLWVAYASSLQAYREAVRNAREQEVLRLLNDGGNISAGAHESQVDTAKRDLKARYRALYAALDRSQRRTADKTLTAGECGR